MFQSLKVTLSLYVINIPAVDNKILKSLSRLIPIWLLDILLVTIIFLPYLFKQFVEPFMNVWIEIKL